MNVARINHTATLLPNGQVLVTGGNNNTDGYLDSAELYDPTKGKWTLTRSMTVPREGHDAALLQNSQVLVAGGINASLGLCGTLASAELYNASTGTSLPNGEVLAAGGTNCGGGALTSAELCNPSTGTWTATGSMTVGNETNWAVLLQNGEVFVLKPYPIEDTNGFVSLFDPSTLTWASAGSMTYVTTRRNHHRAVRALHAMMAGGDCWRLNA